MRSRAYTIAQISSVWLFELGGRTELVRKLFLKIINKHCYYMYWTLELAYHLEDAPWPATRDELIDYAIRSGAPLEVIENLQQMEDEGEVYEGIEEIWPDYPRKDDFLFNEDEY